jgi:hypothetical protein
MSTLGTDAAWKEQLVRTYRDRNSLQWQLGEIIVAGEKRYGNKKCYDFAIAALEAEGIFVRRKYLQDVASVTRTYDASRDARLTFGHHRALMAINPNVNKKAFERWADRIIAEKLSIEDVRAILNQAEENDKTGPALELHPPNAVRVSAKFFLHTQTLEVFKELAYQDLARKGHVRIRLEQLNARVESLYARVLNEYAQAIWEGKSTPQAVPQKASAA